MDWRDALLLACSSALAVAGQVLLKVSADGRSKLIEFVNPGMAAGFICYMSGAALWVYCLARVPLLKAYPFAALTFVLTILASTIFLKEGAEPIYWVGVGFILLGLVFVVNA